jgi:hypothetical protein
MTTSVSPVECFIRSYERISSAGDIAAMAAQFAEVFLAAGPQGSQPVKASDFALALPKRKQLFDRLGCRPAELVGFEEWPLDARYTLAKTRWRLTFVRGQEEAQEVLADSVFIVDTGGEGPRIVLYLANQDILAVLRERGILEG